MYEKQEDAENLNIFILVRICSNICTLRISNQSIKNRKKWHIASCGRKFAGRHLPAISDTTLLTESMNRDGEHDFSWFLSEYIQDIALITMENAETCCADRVWWIWMVGFGDIAGIFSAEREILPLSLTLKQCSKTSEQHQNGGCATIWACTTIRTNTVYMYQYVVFITV